MNHMGSRFVRPEPHTIHISDGDTITVKKRLNHGDQSEGFARMYVTGADGSLRVNPLASEMSTVITYLLDWSLTDDDGHLVQIRDQPTESVIAALNALEPESFAEINAAIEEHARAEKAARDEKKRIRTGASKLDPTLPSPSAAAGALSGSVN
jgi:hypothetical protein